MLLTVGADAFDGCASLTDVSLPDTVTDIGEGAFKGCASLSKLSLPRSLNTIGRQALAGTAVSALSIPEGIRDVPPGLCRQCGSLRSVSLPTSVQTVGEAAFADIPFRLYVRFAGTIGALNRIAVAGGNDAFKSGVFDFLGKPASYARDLSAVIDECRSKLRAAGNAGVCLKGDPGFAPLAKKAAERYKKLGIQNEEPILVIDGSPKQNGKNCCILTLRSLFFKGPLSCSSAPVETIAGCAQDNRNVESCGVYTENGHKLLVSINAASSSGAAILAQALDDVVQALKARREKEAYYN